MIVRADNKQADTIQTKIINALAPYKQLVHTIAADNGKEFTNHQHIAQKLQAGYFFADLYSPWQTGLNEYTNKLFRQFLPKKSNLKNYHTQYFPGIQNKLNNSPRKYLGYKTSLQVFIHKLNLIKSHCCTSNLNLLPITIILLLIFFSFKKNKYI